MVRKGRKQHKWRSLPRNECFTLYHDGKKIHAHMRCEHCGRYHGMNIKALGQWWTWVGKEEPARYGTPGNKMPECRAVPEQLLLNLDCTSSK